MAPLFLPANQKNARVVVEEGGEVVAVMEEVVEAVDMEGVVVGMAAAVVGMEEAVDMEEVVADIEVVEDIDAIPETHFQNLKLNSLEALLKRSCNDVILL